jgi:hypothetical protein
MPSSFEDEHLTAILAQLQLADSPGIDAPLKIKIAARRRRVLTYTYGSGLSESTIASLEGVDQSTISRDLTYWRRRIGKALSADEYIGDIEARLTTIYDGALRDVVLVDQKSPSLYRDRARLRMVALAATVALMRLREGTGRIGPIVGDDEHAHRPSAASDIRKLADEVRRLTGAPLEDAHAIDLTAPGERAFLEGETVDGATPTEPDDADGDV